jgi:hypothetical protein
MTDKQEPMEVHRESEPMADTTEDEALQSRRGFLIDSANGRGR